MSLNFEKCKEVVEKVWGWQPRKIHGYDHWDVPNSHWTFDRDDIKKKVNSWEGFGRTVEAYFKNYRPGTSNHIKFTWLFRQVHLLLIKKSISTFSVKDIIETTHLAALEAIKQEDEG